MPGKSIFYYLIATWYNEDVIDVLMEPKELLKETREFIYQKIKGEKNNGG
jgi:hypothetical protein